MAAAPAPRFISSATVPSPVGIVMAEPDRVSDPLMPGAFEIPISVFLAGESRSLLNWVAVSLLEPYSSRTYWTDVRLPSEAVDPHDPLALGHVPKDHIRVFHPDQFQPGEEEAARAEAYSSGLLRSDQPTTSMMMLFDFLRLPRLTQQRVTALGSMESPILAVRNANWLGGLYGAQSGGRVIQAILRAGVSVVALWSAPRPPERAVLDIVLTVEGHGLDRWREATLRCEKGIPSGPLASGDACRLSDLKSIARFLEKAAPSSSE